MACNTIRSNQSSWTVTMCATGFMVREENRIHDQGMTIGEIHCFSTFGEVVDFLEKQFGYSKGF